VPHPASGGPADSAIGHCRRIRMVRQESKGPTEDSAAASLAAAYSVRGEVGAEGAGRVGDEEAADPWGSGGQFSDRW